MPSTNNALAQAATLLNAAAVRARCAIVYEAARRDESRYFRLAFSGLDEAARRVVDITRRRYPDLNVPLHSRWRHFTAGGVDRADLIAPGADKAETARARIDVAAVSALLDAGAGPGWHYHEAETGQVFSRSEGLAVASIRAMQVGIFSADPANPWRADAEALVELTPEKLGRAFQHTAGNQILGLEGRTQLMRRLGSVCASSACLFGAPARLGGIYDHLSARGMVLPAGELLGILLQAFGAIWPCGISLGGVPLGDCGRHSAVPDDRLVPFHKLCQWLAYSLVEPLQAAGLRISELDGLTGLAEYRNGGLFLDCGVIKPRDPGILRRPLDALSEPVVEWRALTVSLLDHLAVLVRQHLDMSPEEFPLAKVLEGGSWAAGREIAFERRPDGSPPLTIISDGTLF